MQQRTHAHEAVERVGGHASPHERVVSLLDGGQEVVLEELAAAVHLFSDVLRNDDEDDDDDDDDGDDDDDQRNRR